MKLYQDQVLNHMWEFPDDATPEEMDGFVARHHAAAGEHLAKQGWGQELFRAATGFAQPFVNQAAQQSGGGSTLAPYGASDVFGMGTQQVTQLQQNYQQDQVNQQKTAQEERAMLAQQAEQEKDRALRLRVLKQKEKNDKIEADLQSRQVAVAETHAGLAEKRDQRGELMTGPDGGMYQVNYDEAGNPVVGSTPVLPGAPQTQVIGDALFERTPEGWVRRISNPRPSGGGAGAQERPPAPYKWNLKEAEETKETVEEMLAAAGMPIEEARGIVYGGADRGMSPHQIIYGVDQQIRDFETQHPEEAAAAREAAKKKKETPPPGLMEQIRRSFLGPPQQPAASQPAPPEGAEKKKLNGVTGWYFPATGEFQPINEAGG